MLLNTQLQGASGPFLLVLPRNPSPWHCEQDSFATAIVSERFQSKVTNVSSQMFLKLISLMQRIQCGISGEHAASEIQELL